MEKLIKDSAPTKILWAGGWKKVSNGGRNKKQLPTKGHMTLSQVPAVCQKNILHLLRVTQPVENNTYCYYY